MSEVISAVLANRRLRRFTATYAMMFVVISLILNYIKTFSVFDKPPLSLLYMLVSVAVQAPFMFGCIRGIVTKNYSVAKGLGAFAEKDKYVFYLAYIAVNVIYEMSYAAVLSLASAGGTLGSVGIVLTVIMIIVRILLNALVIKIYLDAIFFEREKPRFLIGNIFRGFLKAISDKPGRIIAAEAFTWVVNFVSLRLASSLAGILPAHDIVPLALSCAAAVQFGFIILSWPIYYIYFRETFGISEKEISQI